MYKWFFLPSTCLLAQEIPLDSLVAGIPESATLASKRIAIERTEEEKPVYNWGIGESPFPIPRVIVTALRKNAHKKRYTNVEGIPSLAQALADYYTDENYVIHPGNVIVSAGLKQIIYDIQKVFGGEILHVCPYWVSYRGQAQLIGKEPVVLVTKRENDFKLTPTDIEEHCKSSPDTKRMILFNHPMNPTGAVYSREELKSLAEVFRKYKIIVFADEVYLSIQHDGKATSISEYLPELTIRASSISKDMGAAGWRLGWAVFPDALRPLQKAMVTLGAASYSCAPLPQQYAAVKALQRPRSVKRYLNKVRNMLKPMGQKIASRLREMDLDFIEPQAAWYLWIGFGKYKEALKEKGIHTSKDLVSQLAKETGIIFVPGEAFGMDPEALYVRGAYVGFSGEQGLQEFRIKDPQFDFASELFESLDVLNQWLQATSKNSEKR